MGYKRDPLSIVVIISTIIVFSLIAFTDDDPSITSKIYTAKVGQTLNIDSGHCTYSGIVADTIVLSSGSLPVYYPMHKEEVFCSGTPVRIIELTDEYISVTKVEIIIAKPMDVENE